MANDKEWERRTDEWIKAMEASRRLKEKMWAERSAERARREREDACGKKSTEKQ